MRRLYLVIPVVEAHNAYVKIFFEKLDMRKRSYKLHKYKMISEKVINNLINEVAGEMIYNGKDKIFKPASPFKDAAKVKRTLYK